jgi:cell wall-associated NlpC family hydrolase
MRRVAVGFAALVLGLPIVLTLAAFGASPSSTSGSLEPATVPSAYSAAIENYGQICSPLSPALLAAQLYAESGFHPDDVSPKGAQGIAQFMPATWAVWGVDADGDGRTDPFDPIDAIASAANYDCALARDTHLLPGDAVANMLAAYNAGVYAVLQFQGVPPYPETQNYVQRILALEPSFADTSSTTVAVSTRTRSAIAFAYNVLGTPYEWGGTGADGRFDCSGLTQAAYAAAGITLPRTAAEQWYVGPHVPRSQLRAGDLVFYATDLNDSSTIHHVGLYVGNGYMIDAPYTGTVIRFDSIDQAGYIGAVRPAE